MNCAYILILHILALSALGYVPIIPRHLLQTMKPTSNSHLNQVDSFTILKLSDTNEFDDEKGDCIQSSDLKQLSITFNCDDIDPDELSELMFELGTLSVSVEVISERPDVLNDEKRWSDLVKTKSWANALLKADISPSFDADGLIQILRETYPDHVFDVGITDLDSSINWITKVQQSWKPQVIGDITVFFPWHKDEKPVTKHHLILEGGAAFGTGDHPTTRLCCKWLQRSINKLQERQRHDISVLDYGCGSAILGLAALRFGAHRAAGVDIDKDALISARNNAVINDLQISLFWASDSDEIFSDEERSIVMSKLKGGSPDQVPFLPASSIVSEQYDLTVANILAPILIALAPQLAGQTKAGGVLALSGIIAKQADVVKKAYEPYFKSVQIEDQEDDWVLITAVK